MSGLMRRAWTGLAIAAAVGATSGGPFADRALAQVTGGQECFERYLPPPLDEKGIQCPGEPAIWKSYTYASDGFGYYMEIDNFGGSPYLVRLGYVHRDGRVALSRMVCDGAGCNVNAWNGVPFPYDEAGGS